MIEVGNIVTLENNLEYLLLEELFKEDKRYIFAVRTLEDETLTDEYLTFEAIKDESGEYLKAIVDDELDNQLKEEFRDIVADKVLEINENNIAEDNNQVA